MPLPTIPSGNVASATASTGFTVDNSCCFNKADSAHMQKTLGSGNTDVFTISIWVKRGVLGEQHLFRSYAASDDFCACRFEGSDVLKFYQTSGGFNLTTNQVFRDVGAWYHIMYSVDTGQGTAGNRVKLYVNGTRVTSFSTETQPDEDSNIAINTTNHVLYVGSDHVPSTYFDGYMAEFVFLDGTAAANTDLGEFDSDSPTIWKPVDPSGLTFGTSGFYLDFKDSANLGNDANGGTDLAETNFAATDQSISTPTNIFPTFTPLIKSSYVDIAEGNRLLTGNTAADGGTALTTMPSLTRGKWYIESKSIDDTGQMPQGGFHFNMATTTMYNVNGAAGFSATGGFGWNSSGGVESNLFTNITGLTSGSDGDIKQYAWDMDNGAFYVGINNTWQNSGNPESGASKTGSVFSFTPADYPNIGFSSSGFNSSDEGINFGDPHYANSSDAADADGYGKFEFAPPSGYFSICTKNIAEYG